MNVNGHHDKTLHDLGRRELNLRHYKVEEVLPDHIVASYPKLVKLLETYFQFEDQSSSPTDLLNELFTLRDITQTDIDLLSFLEDELLLGQSYFEGFQDKREAAKYSNTLYKSKGTKYSIQQFFRTFFGIDPDVVYTKENVFKLNESEVGPSSQRYITDDKLYQTYAIQVKSELSISKWREIYKLFVHPAGMYLGAQVQLQGVVDMDFEIQPPPGLLDIPPQEVECIADMPQFAFSAHTALFDVPMDHLGGDEMEFRATMGNSNTAPNAGNDVGDYADKTIDEIHGLQSNILELLEPNSPTFDEHDDDSGSSMGLSSLETIDQDQWTWQNRIRTDSDNTYMQNHPKGPSIGDSDGELTLEEIMNSLD